MNIHSEPLMRHWFEHNGERPSDTAPSRGNGAVRHRGPVDPGAGGARLWGFGEDRGALGRALQGRRVSDVTDPSATKGDARAHDRLPGDAGGQEAERQAVSTDIFGTRNPLKD